MRGQGPPAQGAEAKNRNLLVRPQRDSCCDPAAARFPNPRCPPPHRRLGALQQARGPSPEGHTPPPWAFMSSRMLLAMKSFQ